MTFKEYRLVQAQNFKHKLWPDQISHKFEVRVFHDLFLVSKMLLLLSIGIAFSCLTIQGLQDPRLFLSISFVTNIGLCCQTEKRYFFDSIYVCTISNQLCLTSESCQTHTERTFLYVTTRRVNFTIICRAAFTRADPKSTKRQSSQAAFCAFGT